MTASRFRAVVHAACVLALLITATASAQRARDPRLDLAAEADLHFELGVEMQRRGDFFGALEHYLLSNRLAYNRNVVFNIAHCYQEVGHFAEAYRYYSDYLEEDLSDDDRRVAERSLAQIERRVALIQITSTPPGATIFVDRVELGARGQTPRTLAVDPGSYRVILQQEGYESASAEVRAARGETGEITLSLTPILGTLELVGEPAGAEVRVDDPASEPVGTLPSEIPLVPGHHTLIVSAEGHQTDQVDVTVQPRERIRRRVALSLETGSVLVDAQERGALIEIDGTAMGFTPAVLPRVPSGTHTVRISRSGFRPFEDTIQVVPNEQTPVEVRLRLQQEVTAASRQAESIFDAPASVTVIPQEELRAFGFQTLWDALGGLRGIYQTNDRSYRSLGFRGFSQPQDYGNHLLVLTDGHVMNDDSAGLELRRLRRAQRSDGRGAGRGGARTGLRALRYQRVPRRDQRGHARPRHDDAAARVAGLRRLPDGTAAGRRRPPLQPRRRLLGERERGALAGPEPLSARRRHHARRDDPRRGRLLRGERHGAAVGR